jgi:type II secretory pathway component PulM
MDGWIIGLVAGMVVLLVLVVVLRVVVKAATETATTAQAVLTAVEEIKANTAALGGLRAFADEAEAPAGLATSNGAGTAKQVTGADEHPGRDSQ